MILRSAALGLHTVDFPLDVPERLLEILDLRIVRLQSSAGDVLHSVSAVEVHLLGELNDFDPLVGRVVDRVIHFII